LHEEKHLLPFFWNPEKCGLPTSMQDYESGLGRLLDVAGSHDQAGRIHITLHDGRGALQPTFGPLPKF
jgi:hypothetical protein